MAIAYIGMGGNVASEVGEPEVTLAAALKRLRTLGRVVAHSRLYSTAPVGIADQPRFVNAVAALDTRLGPLALLGKLMEIEQEFGREREFEVRNGPRTLDLDIELYGDAVMESVALTIPHPRMRERAFVLRPLAEIAPEVREPRSRKTVARLLEELAEDGGLAGDAAVVIEG